MSSRKNKNVGSSVDLEKRYKNVAEEEVKTVANDPMDVLADIGLVPDSIDINENTTSYKKGTDSRAILNVVADIIGGSGYASTEDKKQQVSELINSVQTLDNRHAVTTLWNGVYEGKHAIVNSKKANDLDNKFQSFEWNALSDIWKDAYDVNSDAPNKDDIIAQDLNYYIIYRCSNRFNFENTRVVNGNKYDNTDISSFIAKCLQKWEVEKFAKHKLFLFLMLTYQHLDDSTISSLLLRYDHNVVVDLINTLLFFNDPSATKLTRTTINACRTYLTEYASDSLKRVFRQFATEYMINVDLNTLPNQVGLMVHSLANA